MNKTFKVSLFVVVIISAMVFFPLFRKPTSKNITTASAEIRLTQDAKVKHPALGERFITWIEYRDGAYNIYAHDFVTNKEKKLNNLALSVDTLGPVVYGDRAIWVDHTVDGWVFTEYDVNRDILKILKTETKAVLGLSVYEDKIAYVAKNSATNDIFVLNRNSADIKTVTTDGSYKTTPDIFGNTVAWSEFSMVCNTSSTPASDCKLSDKGRVMTYDLNSSAKTTVKDELPNLSEVKIQHNSLAWSQLEGSTNVVKVYYFNNANLITVSPSDYNSYNPVYVGDQLAFSVDRSAGTDLQLYRFSTGKHSILSWAKAEKTEVTLGASSRYVAWVDNRLGSKDIFYFDAQSDKKLDQDADGLTDDEESKNGSNVFDTDTDHDGLTDYEEVYRYHTYSTQYDSDGDGINDGEEVLNWLSNPNSFDSNNDGIDDKTSIQDGFNPMANRVGLTAYNVPRMENRDEEKQLAKYLKLSLDNYLGKGRWHTKNNKDWFKVVNAYLYGGYNIKEIGAYVKGNKNAISANKLATVLREEQAIAQSEEVVEAMQ